MYRKIQLKASLNRIVAAKNEDESLVFEQEEGLVDFNESTWDGEFTEDNLGQIFGLDANTAGFQELLAWLLLFVRNNDQECLRLIKKDPEFRRLLDLVRFYGRGLNGDVNTDNKKAVNAALLAKHIKILRAALLAKGCWKEIAAFLKMIQRLTKFNKKAMDIIKDALINTQKNLDDAFGAAFVANGEVSVAQQYAAINASSEGGGAACSRDSQSGSVDWALVGVIAAGVVIAAFLAGPPGGLAALLAGVCGTANADQQADGIIERAKKIMDRYNDLAGSSEADTVTEEYVDDVVDPTGLSDVEDFDDQGNL